MSERLTIPRIKLFWRHYVSATVRPTTLKHCINRKKALLWNRAQCTLNFG